MAKKQFVQPEGMFDTSVFGFTQVVTSPPGTLVFIAGQVAWDENGQVVSNDFGEQAAKALKNLETALTAAGAKKSDLTHLRIYIPNYSVDLIQEWRPAISAFIKGINPPAQTLIGVQSLARPDLLIEIEGFAVVCD
jgi:enamine deaminase RidA (YjgF/YER057c/UK114 family)